MLNAAEFSSINFISHSFSGELECFYQMALLSAVFPHQSFCVLDHPNLAMDMDPQPCLFLQYVGWVFETLLFLSPCNTGSLLASLVGSRELAKVWA